MCLESLKNLIPVSHVGVVGMDYSWSFCRMRTCKKDCCCCCCCLVASVMHNSVQPYGLQPARFLCPWDSLGKSTGVGCHALLQGIVPDPGIGPGSPALQADYLPLSSILALKIPWTEEPGGPQSRGSQREMTE